MFCYHNAIIVYYIYLPVVIHGCNHVSVAMPVDASSFVAMLCYVVIMYRGARASPRCSMLWLWHGSSGVKIATTIIPAGYRGPKRGKPAMSDEHTHAHC